MAPPCSVLPGAEPPGATLLSATLPDVSVALPGMAFSVTALASTTLLAAALPGMVLKVQ